MADFTDKLAMGTSRMNPSSMVPGAMGGNAPQSGLGTQLKATVAQTQDAQRQALMKQLGGYDDASRPTGPSAGLNPVPRVTLPQSQGGGGGLFPPVSKRQDEMGANTVPQRFARRLDQIQSDLPAETYARRLDQIQSDLPAETQQMLPSANDRTKKLKSAAYKKEDFGLLSDVFKTLSER